jgi:histidine ammonia-lyase
MVPQIVAVALLNECKVLAHPASTDNLPTDGGKEDHVSMGMTAALKLRRIVEAVERVVAIELLAAAEGLEHRAPLKPGRGARRAYERLRSHAPRLTRDRPLSDDIERVAQALRRGDFDV